MICAHSHYIVTIHGPEQLSSGIHYSVSSFSSWDASLDFSLNSLSHMLFPYSFTSLPSTRMVCVPEVYGDQALGIEHDWAPLNFTSVMCQVWDKAENVASNVTYYLLLFKNQSKSWREIFYLSKYHNFILKDIFY